MKFDVSSAFKAKETAKVLTPGIHNATFKGVEFGNVTLKDGDTAKVMSLKLDIEGYGEYTQNFFEPRSDERTSGMYGDNPSPAEQFMISVREILEAIDPEIVTAIDSGDKKLGTTFKQIVDATAEYTKPFIGKPVQVKFIPGSNGYSNMPTFPAGCTKDGNLKINTYFIKAEGLTLTAAEEKKIKAAMEAKPTKMPATLDVDADDVVEDNKDEDDLPF